MAIDKRTFPWIILTTLILGMFIAFLLGFQPQHGEGNSRDQGGPRRNNWVSPAIVLQIDN
jgi:hypothetical protein